MVVSAILLWGTWPLPLSSHASQAPYQPSLCIWMSSSPHISFSSNEPSQFSYAISQITSYSASKLLPRISFFSGCLINNGQWRKSSSSHAFLFFFFSFPLDSLATTYRLALLAFPMTWEGINNLPCRVAYLGREIRAASSDASSHCVYGRWWSPWEVLGEVGELPTNGTYLPRYKINSTVLEGPEAGSGELLLPTSVLIYELTRPQLLLG